MDEVNLSLQGKQLTAFVVNDKIRAFKQRFKYWETFICYYKLDSFLILKGFFDEKCDSLILYDIMSTFGKSAQLRKPVFSNNQSMMIQNYAWLKDVFKVQDRPKDFNVIRLQTVHWGSFRFHTANNL